MKKPFLLIALSAMSFTAFSQVGFHAGLNVGGINSWIFNQNNYGYSEMDYNLKFGANAGLALGYNFQPNYGLEVEFNYVMMGQNYYDKIRDFGPLGPDNKPKKVDTYRYISLNYLQIPVLFRYQTTREKKAKISFHALVGPSVGILLNADQYYEADITGTEKVEPIPYEFVPETAIGTNFSTTPAVEPPEDYFSKLDIGLHADLGVDIYFNENIYLTPALQLYDGFTDLNSKDVRLAVDYKASHNGYAGISVGIHYIMPDKTKKKK